MHVCAVCVTHNRPHLLPFLLWCFQRQTHRDKSMLIFDDHGQYAADQSGRGWLLLSVDKPVPTLGGKRRKAVELADQHFMPDVFAIWDDDEYYFPHALSSLAAAADRGAWLRPSTVWQYDRGLRRLTCHRTYGAPDRADRAYQSGWGLRRDLLDAGLLWPDESYTEDRALARKLLAAGVPEADPLDRGTLPYLLYDPYQSPDRLSRQGGVMAWLKNLTQRKKTGPGFAPIESAPPHLPEAIMTLPTTPVAAAPRPWGPKGDWLERSNVER